MHAVAAIFAICWRGLLTTCNGQSDRRYASPPTCKSCKDTMGMLRYARPSIRMLDLQFGLDIDPATYVLQVADMTRTTGAPGAGANLNLLHRSNHGRDARVHGMSAGRFHDCGLVGMLSGAAVVFRGRWAGSGRRGATLKVETAMAPFIPCIGECHLRVERGGIQPRSRD